MPQYLDGILLGWFIIHKSESRVVMNLVNVLLNVLPSILELQQESPTFVAPSK